MELRQKYIEAKGYDVTDDFMDRFQEINLPLALEIAKHIEKCSIPIPEDLITSQVMGEIIQLDEAEFLILSDIKLIEMDEFLDLINLNLYIKENDGSTQGSSTKEHS
jgi:hypothetical protein